MEGGGDIDKFPSSCRIVAFDSRIGVNGRSEPTTNQPPCCRIGAGGSRRGTIGGGEGGGQK